MDVVSGPVDGSDGHAQTAQAALVHVASDGAAEALQAKGTTEANAHITAAVKDSGLEVGWLLLLEASWLVDESHDELSSQVDGELRVGDTDEGEIGRAHV